MQSQDTKKWFDSFADSFREHFILSSWTIYLLIFIALILIILITVYYKFFRPIVTKRDKYASLFDRLCKVNDIKNVERKYLIRISNKGGLDNPSILFVKRSIFEEVATSTNINSQKIEALRKKLYDLY